MMPIGLQNYAYASRVLTLAVAAMVAERTAHEGLLLADRDYLQWLDIEHDVPPNLRPQIWRWRARLFGSTAVTVDNSSRLRGIRELDLAQARHHAAALIDIASEMMEPVSRD